MLEYNCTRDKLPTKNSSSTQKKRTPIAVITTSTPQELNLPSGKALCALLGKFKKTTYVWKKNLTKGHAIVDFGLHPTDLSFFLINRAWGEI